MRERDDSAAAKSGRGRRVQRTYTQRILAPPEQVFPLICPVREAEWLDGWEYEMVFSSSGVAEKGAVFTTDHGGEGENIWVVTTHDRARRVVEFLRVTPAGYVTEIRVALADAGEATTAATITYTHTALDERGSAMIDRHHSAEKFLHMVTHWEASMNRYLERQRP